MEFTKYDMFAYQILDYLVIKHNYQIIRVQQHKDDIWLMNAKQENYPVIRISSKSNDIALNDTDYIRNVHRVILNLIQREGPILILNTNPDSTPIENVTMTQIRITPDTISNEKILTIFHGLKDALHEREDKDVDAEIALLSKEIEESELSRHQKMLDEAKARSRPKVTMVIMIISIILSLVAFGMMLLLKEDMPVLVACGAYYKMNVVAAHEVWRMLSAGFLHQGPIILALNMLALFYVGKSCEHLYKKKQFLLIILMSIFVGNLFTLISESNSLSMGIGAAVYGVIGAYLAHLLLNGVWKHPLVRFSATKVVLMAVFLLFLSGLSIYAYLGGFITGCMLGMLFTCSKDFKALRKHTAIASLILLLTTCYLGFTSTNVEPIDKEFDASIVSVYQNTILNNYADYLQRCYNKQYRLE